jgi:uncharacterized protein
MSGPGFKPPAPSMLECSIWSPAHPPSLRLTAEILLILAGALLGGFVNGLSGFGTTLVALPFWVHAVSPVVAAQLGAIGGIAGNLQTLPAIWPLVTWRQVDRYIIAGLLGVPIGTYLLPQLEPRLFKIGVGCILVVFCLFQLLGRERLRWHGGGRIADAMVGFCGGFLGGLAGMSGPLPTMWASIRGLAKDEKRVLFQSFNTTMLTAMLVMSAAQGQFSWALGHAALISLPCSILGARVGHWVYVRLAAHHYDRIILSLLLVSGVSLLWGNL